jgi:hypothetical protein
MHSSILYAYIYGGTFLSQLSFFVSRFAVSESSLGFTLAPSGSTCYEYTSIKGEKFKVSIVIVPVSRIVWCCNRGLHCYNPSCTYSRANRHVKK